jgi:soluble lytic murein transglycosylase-like protein
MKLRFHILAVTVLMVLSTVLAAVAGDVAVLRNGFSIRHERRKVIGTITRLYVDGDNSSFVDVPTDQIDHFETLAPDAAPAVTKAHAASRGESSTVDQPLDLDELVNTASEIYKLDPDLVNSVIRAESGFNVRAVSPKGAQGLMQLMPQTASELGVQNAFDAEANVEGGTRYLRELLERYDFDLIKALAAYNAGPERVERYGGVPPYYETRAYVARIVRDFNKKKLAQKSATQTATKKAAPSNSGSKSSPKTNSKRNAPGTAPKSAPSMAAVSASR